LSKTYNVLVFPAGEINSAEIHEALSRQVNIKLFGACSIERIGKHLFSNYKNDLPMLDDGIFFRELNMLVRDWSIDLIIPTHDTVVEVFSNNREKIVTKTLLPSIVTATICRNKRLTYKTFANCNFTPKTFNVPEDVNGGLVFVKPVVGQGSVGARLVDRNDSKFNSIDWAQEIVCEYLPGEELTVDCITDMHSSLLGVYPRTRIRTLGGVSVSGIAILATPEINEIAQEINRQLNFVGMWYFQVKKDQQGFFKLLEISARCSGSQCLTRMRGVNLPLLSVYVAMGREVVVKENSYEIKMDRTLLSMYEISYEYDHVYIDFDDTITTQTGVDTDIIRLLFQFKNDGKKVTLITRHEGDIRKKLESICLSENLFSNIIHLRQGEEKSSYIDPQGSIFIDNAFSERCAVQHAHMIPVFDVNTTQALQKWVK
jgi:ATP-grasp in the biosynthetic pathway with Ter operon